MGNKQSARSIQPFLLKYANEITYLDTINTNIVYNSVIGEVDSLPVVCKMYFDSPKAIEEIYARVKETIDETKKIFEPISHPNLLSYDSCYLRNNCILIMRQYMCNNLRDRMIQKIPIIQKKWLAFQLIWAVSQLHSKVMTHGDLKPENILLTSYDWLFVTDFLTIEDVLCVGETKEGINRYVNYKPTYVEEESWNLYNMFFGELDNNKKWYIAPERCLSREFYIDKTSKNCVVQPSMDVFSVGWIIAEIFLDGKPLFDLARHQLYRRNQFNPKDILRLIRDEEIENLIMDMIALNPQERRNIDYYKDKFLQNIFPQSFSWILYQLGSVILRENLLFPDERIAMIRKYIDAVWVACFGEEIGSEELINPTNSDIFEYLRFENFPNIITDLCNDFDCIISHKNNGERSLKMLEFENDKDKQNANDSALVLVTMMGNFIQYCRYPDTKILALEMMTIIGKKIKEEFRLQYIVPYAISCFKDAMCKVKLAAINCVIEVLKDWEYIEINHTDYYVFDTYLFPAFYRLLEDHDKIIQLKFIEILPDIVNIGKMFIASVNMHKQKTSEMDNDEEFEYSTDKVKRLKDMFDEISSVETYEEKSEKFTLIKCSEDMEKVPEEEDKFETWAEKDKTPEFQENSEEEIIETRKTVIVSQRDDKKRYTDIMESIKEDNIPETWSRKRFCTEEQKVRSFLGLGYNIHLNDTEYNIAFDQEKEKEIEIETEGLKEKILEVVVDKIIVAQDPMKSRVLMDNIEEIAEFLGETINSERLLAYILSFPNLKDDILTMETLKGLRVFSQYVTGTDELTYILTSCDNLLYDPNELIVIETLKTFHYFAEQHQHIFQNNERWVTSIKEIIEFWMHPNQQIKHWAVKTFCEIIKHKSTAFIYWNLYPIIKRYLNFPDLKCLGDPNSLCQYIQPQVSRFCFDLATNRFYFTSNKPVSFSSQDNSALCLIQAMIDSIPKHLPSNKNFDENWIFPFKNFSISKARYNDDFDLNQGNISEYVEKYYYPMKPIDLDIRRNESNYDINKSQRLPNRSAYDIHNLEFYNSVKGLVLVDENLLSGCSKNYMIKRTTEMDSGEDNGAIIDWHPKGRLIDTIYPVNSNNDIPHPVTSIATSEDSKNLISGSQNGMLHYFRLDYDKDEIRIEWQESMLITDLNKPKQINDISVVNSYTTFWVGMDEGMLDVYSPYGSNNDCLSLIQRINKADEGSICKTTSFSTDFSRDNVFAYATQIGNVHIHDLRVRFDVNTYFIGRQFGIPSSMTTANMNSTHKILVGTMGGFMHLYDVRYNVPMEIYEHSRNHPIFDTWMYYPKLGYKYKMFCEMNETQNPHCLVSSGGSVTSNNQKSSNENSFMIHEVSFLDIYTGQMKAVFTVDDIMHGGDEPVSVSEFYRHDPIALSRKGGTLKFRDGIYKALKTNYVTKILCPLLLNKEESAPYFISAGTDRKIRYWTLAAEKKASYYNISTPIVNESEYKKVYLGDIYWVQEKVTERPAGPAKLITGISYSKKSKAVIANKSTAHPVNAINEVMYPECNGISACQTFNTSEFIDVENDSYANSAQGSLLNGGDSIQNARQATKFSKISAHEDAILDMAIAQDPKLGPYLFTAGRDGVIKCFS